MDEKSPDKSSKSKQSSKFPVIAAGMLTLAAAGGGAYYFDYLPQIPIELPFEMPWADPVIVVKSRSAHANSTTPKTTIPASGVIPTGAASNQASDVANTSSLPVSATGKAGEQPKSGVIAQKKDSEKSNQVKKPKSASTKNKTRKSKSSGKPVIASKQNKPRKRKAERSAKQVSKPEKFAELDNKIDSQDVSQQAGTKLQDVLLVPEPSAAEPVYTSPQPESLPAPAPEDSVPLETVEPPLKPMVITPKYNDIMTPVLRGDRVAVKQLLDLGWWVDKPSDSGITPLTAAVMNRDIQMAQLLLDHGAVPRPEALKIARKNKDSAMILLLEQRRAR